MKTLILDSSTPVPFVALLENDKIIFYKELASSQPSSKHLLPLIESAPIDHLDQIMCGCGPGSYTGIRIALSIAKGLSYALKIPLIAFDALNCIRSEKQGTFYALLDAKSSGFYVAKNHYDIHLTPIEKSEVLTKEQLLEKSFDFLVALTPQPIEQRLGIKVEKGFFDPQSFKHFLNNEKISVLDPFPIRYLDVSRYTRVSMLIDLLIELLHPYIAHMPAF
jgi:tRNA threonylcarbamoyl adenosine modification protein YeaZ